MRKSDFEMESIFMMKDETKDGLNMKETRRNENGVVLVGVRAHSGYVNVWYTMGCIVFLVDTAGAQQDDG